ncbi:hypothetical protein IU450_07965 [Nocardia abscessus]|nr:hypothetical protein [Nocardia abscessus]MBF6335819.1 hypothetical protein [Nocardia abscessus]
MDAATARIGRRRTRGALSDGAVAVVRPFDGVADVVGALAPVLGVG